MRNLAATLFTLCIFSLANAQTSSPALKTELSWQITNNNYQNTGATVGTFTLKNTGNTTYPAKGWKIYFTYPRSFTGSANNEVTVTHINGDLYSLTPTANFTEIEAGAQGTIQLTLNDKLLNVSDAPTGVYMANDGEQKGYLFKKYTIIPTLAQYEPKGVVTPEILYNQNKTIADITVQQLPKVFPTPINYQSSLDVFTLSKSTQITADPAFAKEVDYLNTQLNALLTKGSKGSKNELVFIKTDMPAEAYELSVTTNKIEIKAGSAAGAFYAIQSLFTSISPTSFAKPQATVLIPGMLVNDAPRFGYRAFMLDVARHFEPQKEVLKTLDLMALYKMNILHLHFSDDEGWRIEIPGLSELTTYGATRAHTLTEDKHLQPAYGSGPDSNTTGSGFYTRAQFIEILEYATARHIQVIPEIESPGHGRAAIKSMTVRYNKYMQQGNKVEAEKYLLYDLQDSSTYTSVQGYNDNVMNVALPSVYTFTNKVIDELQSMYKEAGAPLTTIHMGGDEVPGGVWAKSPVCIALMQHDSAIKNTNDLWYYYFGKMNAIVKQHGLFLSGWEEIAMRKTVLDGQNIYLPNPDFANQNFQADVWNNVIGSGSEDLAYRLANAGYKVVLSCVSHNYYDMAYNKSFDEPGYYWGGFTDVDKPFYFIPYDYFKNTKEDGGGNPVDKAIFAHKQRLTEYGKQNIVGIKGLLWGENVPDTARMEYLILPKILGTAERGWAKDPEWATETDSVKAALLYADAWNRFTNIVGKRELPRLSYYKGGYNYRIPKPGVVVENGFAKANIQLPGFIIRYSSDGKEPTVKSPAYTKPVAVKGTLMFKAFDIKGRSGNVATQP